MMNALLLAVAMTAPAASPDLIARPEGGSEIRLHSGPCVYARVLSNIPEIARGQFHQGMSVMEGMVFPLCWNKTGQSIYIIDDEGDMMRTPADDFQPEPGT